MFPFFQDNFDNSDKNVSDFFQAYWSLKDKKRDLFLSDESKKRFNFDELSKAEQDSELLKDFRKFLEEADANVGDKEIVFESPVRKEGLTIAELNALTPQLLSDKRIVVVPLIEMERSNKISNSRFGRTNGYNDGKKLPYATLQTEDGSDSIEEDLLISEWLKENGNDFLISYYGPDEEPVRDVFVDNKVSVFEVDGDEKILLGDFPEIIRANIFVSDYDYKEGKDVEILEVRRTLQKPLRKNYCELGIFGDRITDRSKIVPLGFSVIGVNIRSENIPIYREIQEAMKSGTCKQLLKEREEMDKKNA